MCDIARAIVDHYGYPRATHEATCAMQEMNGREMTPEEWSSVPVDTAAIPLDVTLRHVAVAWDRARRMAEEIAKRYSLEFQIWRRDNMVLDNRLATAKRFRALMKLTREESRLLNVGPSFLSEFTPDERKQLEERPETDE